MKYWILAMSLFIVGCGSSESGSIFREGNRLILYQVVAAHRQTLRSRRSRHKID